MVLVLVVVIYMVSNNPAMFRFLDYEHEDENEDE
jgi:hypothetical protein